MKLEILGAKVGSSPRLRRLIELRMAKALRRFKGKIRKVVVRLEAAKNPRKVMEKNCSVEVSLASNRRIYVKTSDRQIGKAVALASKRASQSVQREADKQLDHRHKGGDRNFTASKAA